MTEFKEHLREISRRLPLPEPVRSRVLLEIASDMDDLLHHHLAGGMEKDRAIRAVVEQFDLSDDALQELARVHDSTLQRSLEGLALQAGSRWERGILAILALVLAVSVTRVLLAPSILRDADPVVFGIVGVLLLGVAVAIWKGFGLFGSEGRRSGTGRRGLRVLPLLAGLLLLLGFAGVWLDLYRAALRMRSDPGQALVFLAYWLHMASATLVVALAGGLLVGLLWFFLETRARHLEATATARLFDAAS